jgi:hypothetical protein
MTRATLVGKLLPANMVEGSSVMVVSESQRRTLALWSLGLTLVAITGSMAAWSFVDGYAIDWPLMGVMAATLGSMAAVLANPTRPRLRSALNGIAIALTFPFATWVLWRIFA